MKGLREYLRQCFAPFRKLPPGDVEPSWDRVLQRFREEPETLAEDISADSESIRPSAGWRRHTFVMILNIQRLDNPAGGAVRGVNGPVAAPEFVPPLPKAFEEQLGLHLEPRKVPVEFLIVEHIEKPSEN